mmetsp:Transcript_43225/g.94198  ORF Transcript_43225/g.94198 Transcript_43225/m.94198 type:complete len:132 (-) Transcript_43225:69-464(-)
MGAKHSQPGAASQAAPEERWHLSNEEEYLHHLRTMDEVLTKWTNEQLDQDEAYRQTSQALDFIRKLDVVDSVRVEKLLEDAGYDDVRRVELENTWHELVLQCGKKVPDYNALQHRMKLRDRRENINKAWCI